MSADFDKEGLKNIIYIFGSEKGLGSVDKFFFLILLGMAFVCLFYSNAYHLSQSYLGFLPSKKDLEGVF